MESYIASSIGFLNVAVRGLIVAILGIVFIVKNIKWKRQKQMQGRSTISNNVGIIIFSFIVFCGVIWLLCYGGAGVLVVIVGLFAEY